MGLPGLRSVVKASRQALLDLIRLQQEWIDDAMIELEDIRAQYGDEQLYLKHNERFFQELSRRLITIETTSR